MYLGYIRIRVHTLEVFQVKEIQRSYMQFYSSIFRHCEAVSSLISKHPILFVLFFVKPQSLADNAKEMWVLLISLYLKMDMNKQSTSEMLDWFRICVIFTWTSIPKVQEIWPPEAAIFSSIYKCQINIQLQGCGTVGALMGIYLEGILTTKADIEDDTSVSFQICVMFTWTPMQENWLTEAAIFASISKSCISNQLQGCGTVGAQMGIYLEGIFTSYTKQT